MGTQMKNLILILITLLFSILFLFYSPVQKTVEFPFSDQTLTVETYLYFLFEHLTVLILAIVIFSMATQYQYAYKIFVIIQVIDTVDYVLTYGEPWNFLPVSWNVIKVFIFSSIVAYEIWKHYRR